MKGITFGQLLEKLLYLSNQKKSTLAKELGYDVSYISKWINEKNLPTQKSVPNICKMSSEFIVKSLTPLSTQELKNYFEIDIDNEKILTEYIERSLKEAYMNTAQKSIPNIYKSTQSEDSYNSIVHINPSLRKKYLSKDTGLFVNKSGSMDIIISTNLYQINNDDKMSIASMKKELYEMQKQSNIRARLLLGLNSEDKDEELLFNAVIILNMLSTYTDMDFNIYHCELNPNSIISVIKDRIFHSAILNKDGRSLFTSMSKEKNVIDEMYYSLEDAIKTRGNLIVKNKSPKDIINEKDYVHFIMGQDLRFLIGSMNEFFMPVDLFKEVAQMVFDDDEILEGLNQINVFLNKVTYSSKIKVLIYEEELKKYISTGELSFFNITVKLKFEQVERHIGYMKKIIEKSDNIDIRLVDGSFVNNFKKNWHPSLYLSKSLKLTKVNAIDNNDYLIVKDNEFRKVCDKLFDYMWEKRSDVVVEDKEDINERIEKLLAYTRIVNDNFNI